LTGRAAVAARFITARVATGIARRVGVATGFAAKGTIAPPVSIAAITVAVPEAVRADIAVYGTLAWRGHSRRLLRCRDRDRRRAKQPVPEPFEGTDLRHSRGGRHRDRRRGRWFHDRGRRGRHGFDLRRRRQQARHQGSFPLGFLVAIADVRIIDTGLVHHLVARRRAVEQLLLVVADAPQRIGRRLHVRIRHDHQ
jgi:hypothetical protein